MSPKREIVFYCAFCGQKIGIAEHGAGRVVNCPSCRKAITVPSNSPRETPPVVAPKDSPPIAAEAIRQGNDRALLASGIACLILAIAAATWLRGNVIVHTSLFAATFVISLFCLGRRAAAGGAILLVGSLLVGQFALAPAVAPAVAFLSARPESAPAAQAGKERADEPPYFDDAAEELDIVAHEGRRAARPELPPREPRGAPPPFSPPVATPRPEVSPPPAPSAETMEAIEAIVPTERGEDRDAAQPVTELAYAVPSSSVSEDLFLRQTPAAAPPRRPALMPLDAPSLPLTLYEECEKGGPFYASGWMGYIDAIEFDECWTENPRSGQTCIRLAYNATYYWGGVAWQDPPNNWGDEPAGGYNLTGARELKFWARAEESGTVAEFKVGLRGSGSFGDTVYATTGKKKLSKTWREYAIRLDGRNLSRIITGFVCVVEGGETPRIIYLDDISFE